MQAESAEERASDAERHASDAETRLAETGEKTNELIQELATARGEAAASLERSTYLERELDGARTRMLALQADGQTAAQRSNEAGSQLAETQARCTELEADLAEAAARIDEAERRTTDVEVELAALNQRMLDAEAAATNELDRVGADLAIARERITELETALALAQRQVADAAIRADGAATALAERAAALEIELNNANGRNRTVEDQLAAVTRHAEELERAARANEVRARTAEDRAAVAEAAINGLEDRMLEARDAADDAITRADALAGKAEAADMAIGRASALQRQLDEALTKLAWMERDLANVQSRELRATDAAAAERVTRAEERAHTAEKRVAEAERRAASAEDRLHDSLRQLLAAEKRVSDMERAGAVEETTDTLGAKHAEHLAQLERQLADAHDKLAQLGEEREMLLSELRAARGDTDVTKLRTVIPPTFAQDPEVTAQRAQVAKLQSDAEVELRRAREETAAAVAELERVRMKTTADIRTLEDQIRVLQKAPAADREATSDTNRTISAAPPDGVIDSLGVLEEAIDSLRANMRAATDETAMMDQTESVQVVAAAVSQAAEHLDRARSALRTLLEWASK
jgi:chromosome segregation ATPase